MKRHGIVHNFHFYVSLSDLYVYSHDRSTYIAGNDPAAQFYFWENKFQIFGNVFEVRNMVYSEFTFNL